MDTKKLEWEARWSGGMREAAVLVRGAEVLPQQDFARHICHVRGGSEKYRAEVQDGDIVLLLYLSGSGKTESANEIPAVQGHRCWDSWDEAEQDLGLPEGSLRKAFR